MQKRISYTTSDVMRRAEQLVKHSSNRYRITVQIANRAKQQRNRNMETDEFDEISMKPVTRAIIDMSDEMIEPELLPE